MDLALAETAVKAGQEVLGEILRNTQVLEKRIGREWKIETDARLESAIIPLLKKDSNYPILSEESGNHAGVGSKRWIVDPLDGSVNLLRGLPMYCISVGLW